MLAGSLPRGGPELHNAIVDNDVPLVSKLTANIFGNAEAKRLKALPGGNDLTTVKALTTAVESLITRAKTKAAGAPTKGQFSVLVVTPSAPRAASLSGAISRSGTGVVAKLFGRHLTVDEQAAFLGGHFVDVAIGTPNRLGRLAAMGALELKALRWVLIDSTPDEKHQTFFTCDLRDGGQRRLPDGNELVAMLGSELFKTAFERSHAPPALVPCILPARSALETATPVGQRMLTKGRGKGGGKGRGGVKGRGGGGRGGLRTGAIDKRRRSAGRH